MTLKKGDHCGFLQFQDSAGKCYFPENSAKAAKWWPPLHLLSRLQTRPRLCWGSPPNLPSLCNAQLEQPFTSGFYLINIAGPLLICFFASYSDEHLLHQEWVQQSFSDGRFLSWAFVQFSSQKEKNYVCIFAIVAKGCGWGGGSKPKVKMSIASATRRRRKITLI